MSSLQQQYMCTICHAFTRSSFKAVLRHMSDHRSEPHLSIVCGLENCSEVFGKYETYRKHVYRKHTQFVLSGSHSTDVSQGNGEDAMDVDMAMDEALVEEPVIPGSSTSDHGDSGSVEVFPKRSCALFLMKTREVRCVTQTALNGIVQDVRGFWEDAVERMEVIQY